MSSQCDSWLKGPGRSIWPASPYLLGFQINQLKSKEHTEISVWSTKFKNSLITNVLFSKWDILDQHGWLSTEENPQHCLEQCIRIVKCEHQRHQSRELEGRRESQLFQISKYTQGPAIPWSNVIDHYGARVEQHQTRGGLAVFQNFPASSKTSLFWQNH